MRCIFQLLPVNKFVHLCFQVQNFGTLIRRSREIDEMLECRLLGISSWNVMGY